MCKKNFEGKALSPPSNDDIDEETIVDDSVNDEIEIEETIIKPKKRSRKKKPKAKICKTCGGDILANEMRDMLMFQDTYHQLQAKEYCEEHEQIYSDHKCKPHWCGDCRYLTKYEIEIQTGK